MANRVTKMYASYDRTAELFSGPVPADSDGVAIRSFMDAVNNTNQPSDLANHPDDFELYYIGEYDFSTGLFNPVDPRSQKPLVTGTQAKIKS